MKRLIVLALTIVGLLTPEISGASEQSKLLYSRGLVEFHAEHYTKALEIFDQAVAADAADVYARYYRAMTRGRLNDFDGAISDLRAVLAAKPDFDQAALDLGVALIEQKQYGEALPYLEQAQRVPELDARASLFLGLAQLRLGQNPLARENFERAAARDPEQSLAARYYQGVADYQEGNWSRSEEQFTHVAKTSPDSAMGKEAAAFLVKLSAERRRRYQVYGAVGLQYDTNVVLAPAGEGFKTSVLNATGVPQQEDGRVTLGAGGTYLPLDTERVQLALGYDFFQSLHFVLKGFNLQDHGPSLQIASYAGPVQYGLVGRYDYYLLETDSFLQEVTALPWLAIDDGQAGRTELSYRMRRRDFKKSEFWVRDAFNHAVAVRQLFYLGSTNRYLSLGYQFDRDVPVITGKIERPQGIPRSDPSNFHNVAQSFAYDGNEVDVGFGWDFGAGVSADVNYGYRHERYAHESAMQGTLANGSQTPRRDNEHLVIVSIRKQLTEIFALLAGYSGDFNNSSNSLFEFDRNIGSLALEVRFR